MPSTTRLLRALAIVLVVTAAAIAVAVYLGERDLTVPATTPVASGITAHASELRTVPDVGRETRGAAGKELAAFLDRVYTAAFTRPIDVQDASPSPGPARRVRDLFTSRAAAALKADPDVFDIDPLVVVSGRVNFSGIVAFVGKDASGAVLDVDFVGRATPINAAEPVVRVHQRGTVDLLRTEQGWLVRSFELRIATRPDATPSPDA